jgi:hypothetical protein
MKEKLKFLHFMDLRKTEVEIKKLGTIWGFEEKL